MTYCVGWKYRNNVYLVGDSVFTNLPDEAAAFPETTFGEAHAVVNGQRIAEAGIKITEIAPGIALAFAGDVVSAINVIDFIRDYHADYPTPEALFSAIRISAQPQEHVEILLACAPASGPTTLTKWDSENGVEQPKSDFREIGNLPVTLRRITLGSLDGFARRQQMHEASLLPMMTALMQSHGIHDYLPERGVGGIMFGLRVTVGTTAWQADTAYLLYDLKFDNMDFNFAMMRGDILTVYSSRFNVAKHLPFPSRTRTAEQYWNNIPQQIDINGWHHFSGLRKEDRRVTSIYRPLLDVPSLFIKFSGSDIAGDPRIKIEPTPEFWADLCRPISPEIANDPRFVGLGYRFLIDQPDGADDLRTAYEAQRAAAKGN